MTNFHIRFIPDGREVVVDKDTTLLEAARRADVYVGGICAGEGTCGKCRVIVCEGEVAGESSDSLLQDETRPNCVLACQVVPRTNLVVEVPPESRLGGYEGLSQANKQYRDFSDRALQPPSTTVEPLVEKFALALAAPTVDDPTADRERLLEAVAKRRPGPVQAGLEIARELPRELRRLTVGRSTWNWQWDGHVTATVGLRGNVNEVLSVEMGDTAGHNFGVALDLGTTTIVAHLIDLASGATRDAAAKYNSQINFGADVISRINYARQPHGAEALHRAVINDIQALIDDLLDRARLSRGDVSCLVAAGNTVMSHFLLGLEADLIRISPFVPAMTSPPPFRAADIGLRIHPRGILYTMPMAASYVGGDITAGILASGMYDSEEIALLLDIGTNGEVVVGNRDFLVACSASAGPAFEGGSISCGMRATRGAIDSVRILPQNLTLSTTTIDACPSVGLCGTGLIDAIAEMLMAGIVDRGGRFQCDRAPAWFRHAGEDGRAQFVLVGAKESGNGRDIVLTEADVENLIRTKGAIYAAADSLVQSIGLSFADIQKVYIAGAFGNRLNVAHCIAIGLLPDLPVERIKFIGNSSVAGAKLVMLSRRMFDEVGRIRDRITYLELMVDPAYMEQFTSACFLPHTDLSRFPSAVEQHTLH